MIDHGRYDADANALGCELPVYPFILISAGPYIQTSRKSQPRRVYDLYEMSGALAG